MKKLCWNVYIQNFNKRKIDVFNIFDHGGFLKDIKEAYNEYKEDFKSFEDRVNSLFRYYFWSRCEWEIILSDWPPTTSFIDLKVDVYNQIQLNWNIFIDYLWTTLNKESE